MNVMQSAFLLLCITAIVSLTPGEGISAQRDLHHITWYNYIQQLKLAKGLSLHTDVQLRQRDQFRNVSLMAARTGVSVRLTERLTIGAGGSCFVAGTLPLSNFQCEWRPHAELVYADRKPGWSYSLRLRTEQRYFRTMDQEFTDAPNNNTNRTRLRAEATRPVNKNWSATAGTELFFNPANTGAPWWLDQHRVFIAAAFQLSETFSIQPMLMYFYVQPFMADQTENHLVYRLNFRHAIDLVSDGDRE